MAAMSDLELVTVRMIWGASTSFVRQPNQPDVHTLIAARVLDLAPGFQAPRVIAGLITAQAAVWPLTSQRYARVVVGRYDCKPAQLVDTQAAAVAVSKPDSTIRRWALEGILPRAGKDQAGRTLYVLSDVHKAAKTRAREGAQ